MVRLEGLSQEEVAKKKVLGRSFETMSLPTLI